MNNDIKKTSYIIATNNIIYNDMNFKDKGRVLNIDNSVNLYNKKNSLGSDDKIKKTFNENNVKNYLYLGSTNTSLLNDMGITLEDDGSLLLIKGKSHDLFTGLYQKHFNKGFKYEGFNIDSTKSENIKFKELYVDLDGNLIGRVRNKDDDENKEKNGDILYKINFKSIDKEYDLKECLLNKDKSTISIEYEEYMVDDNKKHDLSSVNNIVEAQEKNIIKINREGLNITIELKDNQLFTTGLPKKIESKSDEPDGIENQVEEHKIKLPLNKKTKILAIKPILNQIQLVVENENENETKIYYLNPLNIFAVKNYQYEVTRLKQEPPLSFYSMVGENNYKNYHPGQPFSSQTVGNFSSRHIPFFSSLIDNYRVHVDKAKEQYALKKYKSMALNIAKSIDPGFRGLFSNIKQIVNSSTSAYNKKTLALYGVKENIAKSYNVLNRVVKGINNGKKQGEIIHTLVKELKEKESITIEHANDIRAFFGINAFNLPGNIGVNAFILASYAKTHSIILSKNEKDEVTFSFVNNNDTNLLAGLSAGVSAYNKCWDSNNINYGFVTPVMASMLINMNYTKSSNFSFKIDLNHVNDFINKGLDVSEDMLKYNSTLEESKKISIGVGGELRSEVSFNVDVTLNNHTGMTVPRNALGANLFLNLLKLNININKITSNGDTEVSLNKKDVDLDFFELGLEFYRDLKFTPSSTTTDNNIQWYPLATVKDFELMVQKKINSLLKIPLFNSEKLISKQEEVDNIKNLKGVYKRMLKINKLIDKYPDEYTTSKTINKADDIYLNLSADKKQKNKLKEMVNNKNNLINNGEIPKIDTNTKVDAKNNNIKIFLSELKEKKEKLSSQQKDNKNEKFKPYVVENYKLNEESKSILLEMNNKINEWVAKKNNNQLVDLKDLKESLDSLYHEYKEKLSQVEYQIESIDLMSISEMGYKKKTLPTGFVRLGNKKAIIHHQVKGQIQFTHNNSEVDKISSKYYFI